ncbi:hypothetical protein Q7C_2436 [Methylophaga frappieri]|uniref:Inner membrane protein YjeT (Clustered with HflC) n=1 Tax=Methylophaga frappieri (strain ATCC BAA-2434 / DSM 25690 / JAM7) TaxID=754477 RepID=I1YKW8_METFJ|nr:DUF2065 domain-containing protein [Methylophaga frappieri]AFJ03561.1 hypothetical protein Q7C_2436 [Methylophaga frappieri]
MLMESLWIATALMLVIEGILPFLSPTGFRDALRKVSLFTDAQLRVTGLVSMVVGLLILYWIN